MLLTRIEEVPQNPADSEDKYNRDKKNYIAEARFLRAYLYWELFLRYGPIPIVTEVLDPNGDLMSKYTTRPTTKEYVVDFILEELQSCEGNLLDYENMEIKFRRTHRSAYGMRTPVTHYAFHGKSTL